ncbi:hypothetical protein LTR17_025656 [Elasticomyces elasticus]|nr:hypothetical protein LTR17_025656 [Elasticomyces elasticus]
MTAAPSPSRLLALPKEIRLIVYDMLFDPMTIRPDNFESYVLITEWPKINTSIICKLAKVCKQVNNEAQAHFAANHLSKLVLYFDNVPDLFAFGNAVEQAPTRYKIIAIVLHTCPKYWGADAIDARLWEMYQHKGNLYVELLVRDHRGTHHNEWQESSNRSFLNPLCTYYHGSNTLQFGFDDTLLQGWQHDETHNVIAQYALNDKMIDVLQLPPDGSKTIVSLHWVCGLPRTCYVQMAVKIRDVVFDRFHEDDEECGLDDARKELRLLQKLARGFGGGLDRKEVLQWVTLIVSALAKSGQILARSIGQILKAGEL